MAKKLLKKWKPYFLLMPMMILISILIIGMGNAFIQSLGYIPALGLEEIGFQYYKELLGNSNFFDSLALSTFICLISSILSMILGVLICAAMVYRRTKKQGLHKMIRLPILIPHTVTALLVVLILSQSGFVARFFHVLGFVDAPSSFPNLIYHANGAGTILAYVWKQAPFVAYFTLSLMAAISDTLEEAAITLGASPIKAFFAITLPLSLPNIMNAFFIIMTFSFSAYELPFLLGATSPKALPVQAYIEYTHPDMRHRPYAMAMNGIIMIIVLLISVGYFFLMNRKIGGMYDEKNK